MTHQMTPLISEKRAAASLAAIFSFRMLGLFMILPVFSLYATHLKGADTELIGLALGIYGLTQALLQIPLGMLSDRIGRKPVILGGLLIFIIGSIVAANASSIEGIVIGRALQGAGAIGSTLIALLADLTTVESRTKSMAIIGITIGLSFSLAMVLGPVVNSWVGLSGIFWLTAILGACGIIILYTQVPTPGEVVFHRDAEPIPALFKSMLQDTQLLRLDFGIFVLHMILTASFIAIPIVLAQTVGLADNHQWFLYLPVLVLSFIAMLPLVIIAEKHRKIKTIFALSVGLICLTQFSLIWLNHSIIEIAIILFVFFTAFTALEALLPSLISKLSPASSKGTAMGIYSSAQFLGIFAGGSLGGIIFTHFHEAGIALFCALAAALWFILAMTMQKPPHYASHMLSVGPLNPEQARTLSQRLMQEKGVFEASVNIDNGVVYLKVDNTIVDKAALKGVATAPGLC